MLLSLHIYEDALLWIAFKLSHWHCQSFCPSNLLSKLLATIYLHAIWTREWSIVIVRFKKVKRGWGWYKYHDEVCVCREKSSPLDRCVLLFSCPALSSLWDWLINVYIWYIMIWYIWYIMMMRSFVMKIHHFLIVGSVCILALQTVCILALSVY